MARAALTTAPSRVYVGMLILTCLAMLVGITTMALEAEEYGWEQKPQPAPKVDLPKEPAVAPAGGSAQAPVAPKPTVAVATPKVEAPAVTMPATLPPILLAPLPVVEAPKPVEPEVKPVTPTAPATTPLAPTPTGPVPSPFIPGR
ncbi:hypothetical protein BH11PLA2_BH11PLA2_21440 [soil metagenome]